MYFKYRNNTTLKGVVGHKKWKGQLIFNMKINLKGKTTKTEIVENN